MMPMQHAPPPAPTHHPLGPPLDKPSFMGCASRKRKWEVCARMGLVPPIGHGHLQQRFGRGDYGSGRGGGMGGGMGMPLTGPTRKASVPAQQQGGGGERLGGRGGAAAPSNSGVTEAVKWLNLQGDAQFVQMGMPELGPCVLHQEAIADTISYSPHILGDFEIDAESVVFEHDSDWDKYPEVAAAIKAATGTELPFCVALCEEKAIWAVGAATGWKKREQAARLALCIALAANLEDFSKLAKSQREFTQICEAVGISTGASAGAPAPKRGRVAKQDLYDPEAQPAVAKGGKGSSRGGKAGVGGGWGKDKENRDLPLWLNLEGQELPPPLDTLMTEALALANNGMGRKSLYANADEMLAHFVGEDLVEQIQYLEDPEWKEFPLVGEAVKKAMNGKEECLTIAVLETACCWAVGVGTKGKNRLTAAKVALAGTMAIQTAEVGEAPSFDEFPALQEFVDEARLARA